jgi:hypothetical protein
MTKQEKERKLAEQMLELKIDFNDICMREMGLDITDNDYLYIMDSNTIIQIKEKFIKYSEYEFPILKHNEIDLNLIENPRLMETLTYMYLANRLVSSIKIVSISQSPIMGTNKGCCILSYEKNGEIKELRSDAYTNESIRIFNLICKVNKTDHLYDFDKYDVPINKK